MKNWKRITSLFLAAVLCMGLSIPASAAVEDTGFFDVDADAWYADAVEYCVDNGLMSGTSADVDYTDSASRSQAEGRDPDARPAISSGVENMEDYEIIFLGYPIWNGQAPRIISTFLETYDFDGKTIVPFCSSIFSYTG